LSEALRDQRGALYSLAPLAKGATASIPAKDDP